MDSKLNQTINERIKSGKIKMRSKSWFVAEKSALVILIIVLIIAYLLFINFAFYTLQQSGTLEFLEFGFAGLWPFITNIPFPFIIWAGISLLLAYFIYKNLDLSYQKPKYFIFISSAVLILGFGLGFFAYGFNNILDKNSQRLNIPIIKDAYQNAHPSNLNSNYGLLAKITEVKPQYIVARASGGKILIIGNKNEENQSQITEVEIKPYQLTGSFTPRFNDQYFEDVYKNMLASHQAMMVYLENIKFEPGQIIKLIGTKIGDKFYPKKILPARGHYLEN